MFVIGFSDYSAMPTHLLDLMTEGRTGLEAPTKLLLVPEDKLRKVAKSIDRVYMKMNKEGTGLSVTKEITEVLLNAGMNLGSTPTLLIN